MHTLHSGLNASHNSLGQCGEGLKASLGCHQSPEPVELGFQLFHVLH